MGITSAVANVASALADTAIDAYRSRLRAQLERRRLDSVQFSMLVSASVATVGMVVDVVALQLRLSALQAAVDEAVEAGDLLAAEQLRAQLVAAMQEPPASAELMATLSEYIPFLMSGQVNDPGRVIEGDVIDPAQAK